VEQRQSGLVSSASVAPLLKLPRHGTYCFIGLSSLLRHSLHELVVCSGLDNLESLYSSLVDFSELFIHTDEPLGVGQNQTAVFKADYHGRLVAVKRIKCEVLTVGMITP
jgi:hypothetical protein